MECVYILTYHINKYTSTHYKYFSCISYIQQTEKQIITVSNLGRSYNPGNFPVKSLIVVFHDEINIRLTKAKLRKNWMSQKEKQYLIPVWVMEPNPHDSCKYPLRLKIFLSLLLFWDSKK